MASADLNEREYLPLFLLLSAVLAVLAELIGLGVIAYWYTADMGWTGSGSTIVDSRAPIAAAALVPAASLLFGVVTLLIRAFIPARSPRGAALVAANVIIGASVLLAVNAYPQVQPATLIGIGDDGTVSWRSELPVTTVRGLRDQTATIVTLEGTAHRRECDGEPRSVTIGWRPRFGVTRAWALVPVDHSTRRV
jgi:hypothetical protein